MDKIVVGYGNGILIEQRAVLKTSFCHNKIY